MINISFIIPTLNEEKYLSHLLAQFKQLDNSIKYEIIVSDGGSVDKTCNIAAEFGATVLVNQVQTQTIGGSRNLGAQAALGEIYIFCDADILFKDLCRFVKHIKLVFKDKNIVGASTTLKVFKEERTFTDCLFHFVFNNFIRLGHLINWPFARGQCQVVRASAFHACGGYNDSQIHAEDSSLFKKLAKIGKLNFFSQHIVLESPRRYRRWGYMRWIFVTLLSLVGQAILHKNILKKWERVD